LDIKRNIFILIDYLQGGKPGRRFKVLVLNVKRNIFILTNSIITRLIKIKIGLYILVLDRIYVK